MIEFQHVVLTRFGVGIENEEWYFKRYPMFVETAFSSLMKQKNKNFKWYIFVSENMPELYKERFLSLISDCQLIIPVFLGNGEGWSLKYIRDEVSSDYILSSRIDDDDLWREDYTEKLQLKSREILSEGSCDLVNKGAAITFTDGYELFMNPEEELGLSNDKILINDLVEPFKSMSVNFLSHVKSKYHCLSFSHSKFETTVKSLEIEIYKLNDERMWMYNIHGSNDSPTHKIKRYPYVDRSIFKEFGVEYDSLILLADNVYNSTVRSTLTLVDGLKYYENSLTKDVNILKSKVSSVKEVIGECNNVLTLSGCDFLNLSKVDTVWLGGTCNFDVDKTVLVYGVVNVIDGNPKHRAAIVFDIDESTVNESIGISKSKSLGFFKYIDTKPGANAFLNIIDIPKGLNIINIGVRAWGTGELATLHPNTTCKTL